MPTTTNLYSDDIDFAVLALQDVEFSKRLKPNGQLDFSNPESVQQLTRALLKRDFGLAISLPDDRLCPPVPNRYNYILWIQSLLDSTSDTFMNHYDPDREVLGIDIGTGASCIYPLLGCSQRAKWRFIGTDIDEKSLRFAKQNVTLNKLENRIQIRRVSAEGPLIPETDLQIDFTMCNPPFYESEQEMVALAAAKQRPPFTACTGSANEMVTPGGEATFVSRMIDESLSRTDDVQWYSSMLGKFASIKPVVEKLKGHGITNWAVTEFVQGNRTRRWAVAWSFGDLRPPVNLSRAGGSVPKGLLPFPTEYTIESLNLDVEQTRERVNAILSSMPLRWMWKPEISTGIVFTAKPVWSRAARRGLSKPHADENQKTNSDVDSEASSGFKITLEGSEEPRKLRINIKWVKGEDSVLYESFCGMLKRKLEE